MGNNSKSNKIILSKEEVNYLIGMLEIREPGDAIEKFAILMTEEKTDPTKMSFFIKKIMQKHGIKI